VSRWLFAISTQSNKKAILVMGLMGQQPVPAVILAFGDGHCDSAGKQATHGVAMKNVGRYGDLRIRINT
jgi:hydroxymethylpyrimidine pyrophosphatase-like HAD family hydrolase